MKTVKVYSDTQKVFGNTQIGYKKHCNKTPHSISISDESYYVNRFEDFMNRHIDCNSHTPPVYYYGTIHLSPQIAIESEFDKQTIDRIVLKWANFFTQFMNIKINQSTINEIINSAIQIKSELASWINKEQSNANNYKHCDKEYIPNISNSYGYKYCIAFGKILAKHLSVDGRSWSKGTLVLLQRYMERGVVSRNWIALKYNREFNNKYRLRIEDNERLDAFYDNIELSNDRFQSFAFATHPEAYLTGGLTILLKKKQIKDLILIMSTPDFLEWSNYETVEQALITVKGMLFIDLINDVQNFIKKYIESIQDIF